MSPLKDLFAPGKVSRDGSYRNNFGESLFLLPNIQICTCSLYCKQYIKIQYVTYFRRVCTVQLLIFVRNNNYLCTCDLYTPVHNVLEAWIYITRGSWRGLGPGIPEFFGPCEMARIRIRISVTNA